MAKKKPGKSRATGRNPRRPRGGGGKVTKKKTNSRATKKKTVRRVTKKTPAADPLDIPTIADPALDMNNGNDRRDLRAACAKGWMKDAHSATLSAYRGGLDLALKSALPDPKKTDQRMSKDQIRSTTSVVRTMVGIQRMVQIEELINLQYDRIDSGKATARVELSPADDARFDKMAKLLDGIPD